MNKISSPFWDTGCKKATKSSHSNFFFLPTIRTKPSEKATESEREMVAQFDRFYGICRGFEKLIKKPAEIGDISLVTALLDRLKNVQTPYRHNAQNLMHTVIESALQNGQKDLVFALFRKNYPFVSLWSEKLLWEHLEIARELTGEWLYLDTLEEGVKTAISKDQPAILCALLDRPGGEKLFPVAAKAAVIHNQIAILKELVQRGLSEEEIPSLLDLAIKEEKTEVAHFLASQDLSFLNKDETAWGLFKTGFFPTPFSPSMIEGLDHDQIVLLLDIYIRGGQISEQELRNAWPQNKYLVHLFRHCLIDDFSLSEEFRQFLTDQFIHFSPESQKGIIQIAILKNHPDSWIDTLSASSRLSEEMKEKLSQVRSEHFKFRKKFETIQTRIGQKPTAPLWNEEEIRKSLLQKGPEILDWSKKKQDNPENVYFSSNDVVGQIKSMPHLILKSFHSKQIAEERIALMQHIRSVCAEKHLDHLRVPNAFVITSLLDQEGMEIPIHLVIEERLPIVGHTFAENKALLEELNRDPETLKIVNGYLSELTSLVCTTGLADLKANNVPLLEDGSGIGMIDSSWQDVSAQEGLYHFSIGGLIADPDRALIDWIFPKNFEALSKTLDKDPDCRKQAISVDYRTQYEKNREKHCEKDKEEARLELMHNRIV